MTINTPLLFKEGIQRRLSLTPPNPPLEKGRDYLGISLSSFSSASSATSAVNRVPLRRAQHDREGLDCFAPRGAVRVYLCSSVVN